MSLLDPDLTWRCEVCHEDRPDEQIEVAKHVHILPSGVRVTDNVKFCRDRERCRKQARQYGIYELSLRRKNWVLADAGHTLKRLNWQFFALGVVLGMSILGAIIALAN